MIEAVRTVPYEGYWVGGENPTKLGAIVFRRLLLRPQRAGRVDRAQFRDDKQWFLDGGIYLTRAQAARAARACR